MKSREEYQASIYAKRDALLRKRKKNITAVVTAAAAFILISVSVFALPSFDEKLPQSTEETSQTSPAVNESSLTQLHSDYDGIGEDNTEVEVQTAKPAETNEYAAEAVPVGTTERLTMVVRYPVSKAYSNIHNTLVNSMGTVEEMFSAPSEYDGVTPEADEEIYAEDTCSDEEIAKTAFGYLTEDQQAECIDKENPKIIKVTSATDKRYVVSFNTDKEKTYQVQIRYPDLELIEIGISFAKETVNEPSTHKPGYKGGTQ